MFGSLKIIKKEKKNSKENDFLMFDFSMKNMKENKIWLKMVKNLYIFKIFNIHIIKGYK